MKQYKIKSWRGELCIKLKRLGLKSSEMKKHSTSK